jgi:hypothetical protein
MNTIIAIKILQEYGETQTSIFLKSRTDTLYWVSLLTVRTMSKESALANAPKIVKTSRSCYSSSTGKAS